MIYSHLFLCILRMFPYLECSWILYLRIEPWDLLNCQHRLYEDRFDMFQLKVKGTSFHLSNTALGDDKKWCLLVGGIIFWKWGPNATLWSWPPFLNSHFWPMAHPKLWSPTISLARAVHLQSPTIASEQKLNLNWTWSNDRFHTINGLSIWLVSRPIRWSRSVDQCNFW